MSALLCADPQVQIVSVRTCLTSLPTLMHKYSCVYVCVYGGGGEKQREERDRDTQRETEIDVRCFSQLLSTVIFWETGSH